MAESDLRSRISDLTLCLSSGLSSLASHHFIAAEPRNTADGGVVVVGRLFRGWGMKENSLVSWNLAQGVWDSPSKGPLPFCVCVCLCVCVCVTLHQRVPFLSMCVCVCVCVCVKGSGRNDCSLPIITRYIFVPPFQHFDLGLEETWERWWPSLWGGQRR